MLRQPTRIFPLGDRALTVEFGSELSEELSLAAIALASRINDRPFPGLIEAVPAIASATIFFDPRAVDLDERETASQVVKQRILDVIFSAEEASAQPARTLEVPVSFGDADALDLDGIAEFAGISAEKAIAIFLEREYRVFMLGFLPGFAYMGTVDPRIAMPRRSTPRLAVPDGSVAIAGEQTGIYPTESPGGWNIIGRTEVPLITGDQNSPCFFRAGDRVRFVDAAV